MGACRRAGTMGWWEAATGSGSRTHESVYADMVELTGEHVGVRGPWVGGRQLLGVAHVHMRVCTLTW